MPGPGMFWACGNERPTLRLNGKWKYGLNFPATTGYSISVDLMSNAPKAKRVALEITYEYVPKTAPGYKAATMVSLGASPLLHTPLS